MNSKYLFLAGVAALSMAATSCDDEQLDQQPSNQLSTDLILSSKENVATLLNSIYFHTEHYYYLTIGQSAMEVMGNDIKMTNGNYAFSTYNWIMYAYDYVQYSSVVDGWWSCYSPYMWGKAYGAITAANTLIEAANEGTLVPGSEDYVAQAYGMRGWNYLNLYHLYCNSYANEGAGGKGLFYRTAGTGYEESSMAERSNLETSLKNIVADLTYAYENCQSVNAVGRYNMNKEAAALLLARTYSELGDWQNVKKYADLAVGGVYDGSNLMSPAEYQAGFMDANSEWLLGMNFNAETTNIYASFPSFWHCYTAQDKERVWGTPDYAAQVPGANINERYDYLCDNSIDYLQGYSTVRACKSFVDTFKKNEDGSFADCRALFPGYLDLNDGYFIAKFNQHNTLGIADYPFARKAEAYLLAAEACMNGAAGDGQQILNTLQLQRGGEATALNQNEIYLERRRELYGEGFALGDLKRFKMGVNRVGPEHWSTTLNLPAGSGKMMFPIPDNELLYNPHYKDNYNAGQNDNWAK